MTSQIATRIAKRYFAGHVARYEPEDPYYEMYVDKKGKMRRRKRMLPGGLTRKEAKTLRKIKKRAHYLDKGFSVCGFQFGWTFVIGLVPGLGDIVNGFLGYRLVIRPATREIPDLPSPTIHRMLFNSAVSAGVGLVPLVGDVVVAAWKANSRNAHLLEAYLIIKGQENIAAGLPDLTPHMGVGVNDGMEDPIVPTQDIETLAEPVPTAQKKRGFWSRSKPQS